MELKEIEEWDYELIEHEVEKKIGRQYKGTGIPLCSDGCRKISYPSLDYYDRI